MTVRIIAGDCREVLRTLPAESVHAVITSPPYWNLRDYSGGDREIGVEQSSDEYTRNLVEVFREVRRILRSDGTCWVVLGDSFANKNLCMIPARVALAFQADGWWLRSMIVWAKAVSFCPTYSGSVMPESCRDRPTTSHEYVILLSKRSRYYFDMEAIKEPVSEASIKRISQPAFDQQTGGDKDYRDGTNPNRSARNTLENFAKSASSGRHPRSVWTINPKPYRGAHFACYPPALIEPMIKAGSSERGCCPCGAPWERVVEKGKVVSVGGSSKAGRGKGEMAESGPMERRRADGTSASQFSNQFQQREHITTDWQPTCTCGELVDSGALDPNMGTGIDVFEPYPPAPCTILDPFSGAGTTGLVADRLGRNAILIDLNPDYCQMAYDRIKGENPMFTEVALE